MNQSDAYNLCCKYQGRKVIITDNRGRRHIGRITKVDNRKVWIMPDDVGSYGIGFWGYGRPGIGFGYGIALGVITGIVLSSLFLF
ncbi:hypothetical protein [Solibacillus sp. FSL H8-0538]|uniref:hypothetical protein n=1 Tax=Solibacillus sp. FSL H8-0538 TaxID=2921400 RepID=UPI0030F9E13D